MMHNFKSHFDIHLRFRNGILILAFFLSVFVLGYCFCINTFEKSGDFKELSVFQHHIDSLQGLDENLMKKQTTRKFNPNFISDFKGYRLGLSIQELDRLAKYRSENKWINSIEDFKKVTQISDSRLQIISKYFVFPDWVAKKYSKKKNFKKKYPRKSFGQKRDLNSVTVAELEREMKVPSFIAKRIVRYRNKINGFLSDQQLKDIHGLYKHQYAKILSNYTIKTPRNIEKININKALVKELIEIPYFDFETALDIRDYVKENGPISDFKDLRKIKDFSLEKIDRIALYLTID